MTERQKPSSLQQELDQLRNDLDSTVSEMQSRIRALELKIKNADNQTHASLLGHPHTIGPNDSPQAAPLPPQREARLKSKQARRDADDQTKLTSTTATVSVPNAFDKFINRLGHGMLALFLAMLGPFSTLLQKFSGIYRDYRKQGKLPVFLLTLGGILALVVGFGFILQYSFVNLLNEIAKISLSFAFANGVIGLGVLLSVRRHTMKDYAAGLIGLGVLLNYLCIYFLTAYYQLVGAGWGITLLGINTLAAYFLALFFETRIVASISFVGGAFTPFFLGGNPNASGLYLTYLLLLSASALHLSKAVHWPNFATFSFVLVMGIFETFVFSRPVTTQHPTTLIILLHGFFYLYLYHALFDGLTLKDRYDRHDASILTTSLALVLVNLFYLEQSANQLGLLYLVNAVPFAILILIYLPRLNALQKAVLTMLPGIFVGFAIPAILDAETMGLFWGQEALALIYLGFLLGSVSIRYEGYALLLIAVVQTIWIALGLERTWRLSLVNIFFLNLITIGILLTCNNLILRKFKLRTNRFDQLMHRISQEAISLWMAILFLLVTAYLLPSYCLHLSVIPLLYLLYRAEKHQLTFSRYLALAHYGLLVLEVLINAQSVNSLHFTSLPLAGKIAAVEAFLLLFGLQWFLQRFAPGSNWIPFSRMLRIGFYLLLPVIFLPSVYRRQPEFISLAAWLSCAINFALYEKTRIPILRLELLITVSASMVVTLLLALATLYQGPLHAGFLAVLLGLGLGWLLTQRERALSRTGFRQSEYRLLLSGYWGFVALASGVIAETLFVLGGFSLLIVGATFLYLALRQPSLFPMRSWLQAAYIAGTVFISFLIYGTSSWELMTYTDSLTIIQNLLGIGLLAVVSHRDSTLHDLMMGRGEKIRRSMWLVELYNLHLLVSISYLHLIFAWSGRHFGPSVTIALVLHGIFLLFQSVKPAFRVLIGFAGVLFAITVAKILFYDLRDFSLIQKIMAFMAIGVVMLFAAYRFQQYRARQSQTG